jgi:hypothetical protein
VLTVKELIVGEDYSIQFSRGEWKLCHSDEHTICFYTVLEDWLVGIGAYDPNDYRKYDQSWAYSKKMGFIERGFVKEPPMYDESQFDGYTVIPKDDYSGFEFKLHDNRIDAVSFEVCWIKKEEHEESIYVDALGLWLC